MRDRRRWSQPQISRASRGSRGSAPTPTRRRASQALNRSTGSHELTAPPNDGWCRSPSQRRERGGPVPCPVRSLIGFLWLAASLWATPLVAQSVGVDMPATPFALGERRQFWSARLQESREVIVSVPAGYSASQSRFPVLYVLDGGENFVTAVAAARALAGAARVPEMIVVGVVNVDRGRDFTPVLRRTSELPPGISRAGGADAFSAFLGDELVPFIDAHYRTRPLRTLVGHSLGGLLAVYALAVKPELFRRVVALDPSLWWDASSVLELVRDSLGRRPEAMVRIAMVRNDPGPDEELRTLLSKASGSVIGVAVSLLGESHESMVYRGVYGGLIELFRDYVPGLRHDQSLATLAALETQFANLSRGFGYDVPIPLSSLLEVVNREANQRRFSAARAALARAEADYPGSADVASFREAVDELSTEALRLGQGETRSKVVFRAASRTTAGRILGEWTMRTVVTPGTPGQGRAQFEIHGDTLVLQSTAHGVAMDGGDLKLKPAIVFFDGQTLKWDRENSGGGRAVVSARLTPSGRIVGTEQIVDGHPLPVGFAPPEVRIEMVRTVKRAP